MRKLRMTDLAPGDQRELAERALRSKAAQERIGACELCGTTGKELRPYGPKGEMICFSCGMKDEKTTQMQFRRSGLGESIQ